MGMEGAQDRRILPSAPGGRGEKRESPEVTNRKYAGFLSLMEREFYDVDGEREPTVLDFQGLPPGSTEENFFSWIETVAGLSREVIEGKENPMNSREEFALLNLAYQQGKEFLIRTLKYSKEEVELKEAPESLSSKDALFNLLSKTILASGEVRGLSRAFLYCRLVKATIVAYETIKNKSSRLKANTKIFEDLLIGTPGSNAPLVLLNEEGQAKNFYAAEHGGVKGSLRSRGKDTFKAMLRMLVRPEANAKEALKDGIASRIAIEKEKALELVPILCTQLFDNMNVSFLKIENQSFLSTKQAQDLRDELGLNFNENSFSFIDESKANTASMGNFEVLKITGRMDFIEDGNKDQHKSIHSRQFEIQFVTPDTKNERGATHHSIYDIQKLVIARTRLDGGCSESAFNLFVDEAVKESGMSRDNIIMYLTQGKNPVVKMKKKNDRTGESIYIANSVYSRWKGFGWIDADLFNDFERAKVAQEQGAKGRKK